MTIVTTKDIDKFRVGGEGKRELKNVTTENIDVNKDIPKNPDRQIKTPIVTTNALPDIADLEEIEKRKMIQAERKKAREAAEEKKAKKETTKDIIQKDKLDHAKATSEAVDELMKNAQINKKEIEKKKIKPKKKTTKTKTTKKKKK